MDRIAKTPTSHPTGSGVLDKDIPEGKFLTTITKLAGDWLCKTSMILKREPKDTIGILCERGIAVLDRGKWVLVNNGQIKLHVYHNNGPQYDALYSDLEVEQRKEFFDDRLYELEYDPSVEDGIQIRIDDVEV